MQDIVVLAPDTQAPAPVAGSLPDGLDPQQLPILAQHWFGWRPLGAVAADVVQDLTFCRKVQRLCVKGPRVVGELLAELAAERGLGDEALRQFLRGAP